MGSSEEYGEERAASIQKHQTTFVPLTFSVVVRWFPGRPGISYSVIAECKSKSSGLEKRGKEEESLHCSSASPEVLDLLLVMGPHTWRSGDVLAVEGCLYVPAHRATLI